MCGINGILHKTHTLEQVHTSLASMNQSIIHRGPDDNGMHVETVGENSIGLGMQRLSIIDLHTGHQPQFNEDQSLVIVFNGEIYNYLLLKKQLEQQGVTFKTNSDTEVILKLYELEGSTSFAKLDGMYALSILDKKRNILVLARDYFGEKPIYYTQTENSFFWASELKSITSVLPLKPKISKKALNLYLRLTYIPAPYSIYDSIKKLEANSYLTYDLKNFKYSISKIHETKPIVKKNIDFKTAIKEIYKKVNESVSSRSYADVEVGTFLSGGVDSSIVSLALANQSSKPINTFSIGFEKKSFDETDKSQIVAKMLGSKHREFIIKEGDLVDNLDDILLNFDEPFADSSALASYIVANKTSDYLKVALTGDGGDEIFGGYNKYYMGRINRNYTNFVPEKAHQYIKKIKQQLFNTKDDNRGLSFKINKLINAIDYNDNFYWNIISLGYQDSQLNDILLPDYKYADVFKSFQDKLNLSKTTSLTDFRLIDKLLSLEGDMLVKVDRTSMLTSLETRAPFLNKKLWDYTMSLPETYLMNGNDKKYILKKAFEKEFPKGFLDKSKMGFGVPVGDWLRTSLKKELVSYIDNSFLENQGIFNPQTITKIVQEHIESKRDHTFQVWTYYCFQKWYVNNSN